ATRGLAGAEFVETDDVFVADAIVVGFPPAVDFLVELAVDNGRAQAGEQIDLDAAADDGAPDVAAEAVILNLVGGERHADEAERGGGGEVVGGAHQRLDDDFGRIGIVEEEEAVLVDAEGDVDIGDDLEEQRRVLAHFEVEAGNAQIKADIERGLEDGKAVEENLGDDGGVVLVFGQDGADDV